MNEMNDMDRAKMKERMKENYKFYDLNREAINAGHIGDYVLIRDGKVVGYFKDDMDAFATVQDDLPLKPGSIMIHQCLPEEEDFDDIGFRVPVAAFEKDW